MEVHREKFYSDEDHIAEANFKNGTAHWKVLSAGFPDSIFCSEKVDDAKEKPSRKKYSSKHQWQERVGMHPCFQKGCGRVGWRIVNDVCRSRRICGRSNTGDFISIEF
jgi:hypothetical protein